MKARFLLILVFITPSILISAQTSENTQNDYEKSLVSLNDYAKLIKEVKKIRSKKLISFDQLKEFQCDDNTIILDARSRDKYLGKHIKGAINLPFTEFTQLNLNRLIPNPSTRIIIYCNNNFKGDQIFFPTKIVTPEILKKQKQATQRQLMLALNIPTYINLYGYGYTDIYELDELVHINDPRLEMEGTKVHSMGSLSMPLPKK